MAEDNAELQRRLQQLDHELDEGDITHKGYEKRRTAILSEYFTHDQLNDLRGENNDLGGFRFHSPSASIGSGHAKTDSYGSITAGPYGGPTQNRYYGQTDDYGNGRVESPIPPTTPPPSQVQRFQEQQLGMRPQHLQKKNSYGSFGRPQSQGSQYSSPESTMVGSGNASYAFNPDRNQPEWSPEGSRMSTMLDSNQQGYFSDFTGQQQTEEDRPRESYGGPQRYSQSEALSPSAIIPPPLISRNQLPQVPSHQSPLEPRDVPFAVYDPHNANIPMSKFDNIGAVLRHRGKMQAKQPAYWVVDPKGKELSSITWEKFASRAEKVAQLIRDKSNLYRGDRVALVYKDTEVIDFAIALLGCFIAGVVAVPINNVDDYQKLSLLLTTTQAHLALTTDTNLKAFYRDISAQRLKWPAGVEWWKTNEFGTYSYKKKDDGGPLQVPDLAYIEFSRAPTGDLRGVVLSHRTIMHQMACLSAIISTIPANDKVDTFSETLRASDGTFVAPRHGRGEIILSYLDPREGCGLILGVLLGVYGGHTTVWLESKTVDTPGMYAHLITRYRATIMAADYPGLKRAAYNYQQDPMATRNSRRIWSRISRARRSA